MCDYEYRTKEYVPLLFVRLRVRDGCVGDVTYASVTLNGIIAQEIKWSHSFKIKNCGLSGRQINAFLGNRLSFEVYDRIFSMMIFLI